MIENLKFITINHLNNQQRLAVFKLWNMEYPTTIAFENIDALDNYLTGLEGLKHTLVHIDEKVIGWYFNFKREGSKWFAIIVDSKYHGRGIGTLLLESAKLKEEVLNGWVIDSDDYQKWNKEPYLSPLHFYIKNGFKLLSNERLETKTLSALKIRWEKQ